MKKIGTLLSIAVLALLTACGGTSYNKEELMQKLKDNAELTQDDYAGLIQLMDDDCEALAKWNKENSSDKQSKAPEEIRNAAIEILEVGLTLDQANKKDKLDNSNKRKLNRTLKKMKSFKE